MQLIEDQLYHIYNQGNNKSKIFFKKDNYLFFLKKFEKYILPNVKVIAYCLMPNHFHFLLYTTACSVKEKKTGGIYLTSLADGFRQLLSSYAQAINKQEGRSGSLFRQKTKAKLLDTQDRNYPFACFNYIHQNPLNAGLVDKMENWEFSSFQDYIGLRNNSICDIGLAFELLDISRETFYEQSYQVIVGEKMDFLQPSDSCKL